MKKHFKIVGFFSYLLSFLFLFGIIDTSKRKWGSKIVFNDRNVNV